ncbi:MAG: 50S ribosomal protein L15 [Saprospiraceae bacterium]|jgi:large subunit ribosomal protein L15|nr:50S ribosomal protein L15 [Saprospiraceae bacterium]MBK6480603.1 50S ribosomal protein L15 [Saprospiraceae bacterium]MBK6817037.1 50S ribosomal protein L15 [Saprospiraceae bacterium]MBK7435936.1 50S ribosomal protein L15 [Saprospiraceae bacterium]MBK7606583.1 50S ribosomal protein L15 [Saprospiraceae bacterium]
MELSNLKPAGGSTKNNKRRGRGVATGLGGTAGKGHKGHKSRSGHKAKRNFEGGQMPLQMRLPKIGFRNPARQEYEILNLDQLQSIANRTNLDTIDITLFTKEGLINPGQKMKILGRGELISPIKVSAHACSASAKKAIEEKGGTITII